MRRRVLLLVAVGVLLVGVIVGGVRLGVGLRQPADVPDSQVTADGGGMVRLGGATLTVPPGAVTATTQMSARSTAAFPAPGTTDGVASVAPASAAVTFDLGGASLRMPATLSFPVQAGAIPRDVGGTDPARVAWLAYYDTTTGTWQPVESRYDPSTQTVTAAVSHLSTWTVLTWDWDGILTRLRQSLAGFDSGRAAPSNCTNPSGVSIALANSNDPPIIACTALQDDATLAVTVTSNRGYAMVLAAPQDAVAGPAEYTGFEEYERSRPAVMQALGGAYLAPTASLTYTLPRYGDAVSFVGAMSDRTRVLDEAIAAEEAVFRTATAGYSDCILDAEVRSGPAPLSDAPGLIVECFPGVAQSIAAYRWFASYVQPVMDYVRQQLTVFDTAHDGLLAVRGEARIIRPAPPPADLFVNTGYVPGALYAHPNFPTSIGLDNHDGYVNLQWQDDGSGGLRATGVLNQTNCVPDCADGTLETFPIELTASAGRQCTVATYPNNDPSGVSQPESAFVFTRISVKAESGSPNPSYVGDSVFTVGCG